MPGRDVSLTTKNPEPDTEMSVCEVDAWSRPWTSFIWRGLDCTPPAE